MNRRNTGWVIACIGGTLLFSGCVRLGDPFERTVLPEGAPSLSEILSGLAQNENDLSSFHATGTVILKIPEVETTQISRESVLHYRQPDLLYVIGRRYGTRIIELIYSNNAFLIEFPTRREYCLRFKEEAFETITSADIVREMFRPEDWESLSEKEANIVAYDVMSQTATIEIWECKRPAWRKRLLTVQGAPWVVADSKRFDKEGNLIAHTVKKEYHEQDGIRYPTEIETNFPGENAWMRFIMRRVDVNKVMDDALFDIESRQSALEKRGFDQVDIFAGEGPAIEDIVE